MDKMKSNLLIVESPTKARTITKYLGGEYEVIATVGHLRDLPKNKMGVDLAKDLEIDYVVDKEKVKIIDQLIKATKKAKEIYIATDPDREGEAIAWHVKYLLVESMKVKEVKKIQRVSFHEITKEAVEEALKNGREIDMDLVDAQQGRRVLDRVVGYKLSPVLWKKVRRGLSAGRVQSVAVRLICEREKEIGLFSKEKFFEVLANTDFESELVKVDNVSVNLKKKIKLFDGDYNYSKTIFDDEKVVNKLIESLDKKFTVVSVSGKETHRSPLPAFTTSKLQQAGARRFGWSGKQTMSIAQKLYEKGLITYHRTDSLYLSQKVINEFREFIGKKYGENYVSAKVRVYKNNSKNAQEAHEAIRPTNVNLMPDKHEVFGEVRLQKLYELIWKRAVATQGASAKMKSTTVKLKNKESIFRSNGVEMLFPGFLKITEEKFEEQILPALKEGQVLLSKKIWSTEMETNPPARYSDASLVASLERQGIGRPSTYASIISTIIYRQYVEKEEGKYKPTNLGMATNDFLTKNFADILSLPFTAGMEANLDEIAMGKMKWKKMIKDFWDIFEKTVEKVEKEAERVKIETEKTGDKCPTCKEGDLVIRVGRFGKFISCDRFPDCKYTAQYKELAGFKCPECGSEGVVRKSKKGRKFFGCSNYPACKWISWKKP